MTNAVDPQLVEMMAGIATFQPVGAKDFHGKPTYGTAFTAKCHPTIRNRMIRNDAGEQVTSSTTLELDGVYAINEETKLTLEGVVRPIAGVATFYDEAGPHYQEVYLT